MKKREKKIKRKKIQTNHISQPYQPSREKKKVNLLKEVITIGPAFNSPQFISCPFLCHPARAACSHQEVNAFI